MFVIFAMSVQGIFVGTCVKNAKISSIQAKTIQIDFITGDSEQPGAGFQFDFREVYSKSWVKDLNLKMDLVPCQ